MPNPIKPNQSNQPTVEELLAQIEAEKKEKEKLLEQTLNYKNQAKAAQEEKNALEAQRKLDEQKEMERKGEYEKLYKQQLATQRELEKKTQAVKDSQKRAAVIAFVGGLKKPQYAQFINVDMVQLDQFDQPTAESVKMVGEQFKQEYPEALSISVSSTQTHIPGKPAGQNTGGNVDLSKMTNHELQQYMFQQIRKTK